MLNSGKKITRFASVPNGPLLFLICITDLPELVISTARLLAYNCLLYRKICKEENTILLQK